MSIEINNKPLEEYLGDELYEWQDLLVFLADDHLLDFLQGMAKRGELPDITENEVYQLRDFLLNKLMNL